MGALAGCQMAAADELFGGGCAARHTGYAGFG